MEIVRTGDVSSVVVVHRKPFNYGNIHRDTRLVVWAIMENSDRVWVTTVEGDFDKLPVEAKIRMAEAHFSYLSGIAIDYISSEDEENGGKFFAVLGPEGHKISYLSLRKKMAEWIKDNCQDVFDKIDENRHAGSEKAVITRAENREAKKKEEEKIKELENEKEDYRAPKTATKYRCHNCGKTFDPTVKNLVRDGHLVLHKEGKLIGKPILIGNFTLDNDIIKPICHQCAKGPFVKSFPFGKAENMREYKRRAAAAKK